MRRIWLGAMLLLWLVGVPATPAAASHDDYGPGTVILTDAPAGAGDVTVVFRLDTDEQEATAEVKATAEHAGGRATEDGAYRITAVDDVSYRISGWALLAPLLALVGSALVPYLALRGYAAAAVRRGGPPEDQLYRIRRGAVITQLLVPIALIAALFSTGSMDWLQLALGEALPDVVLPIVLLTVVGVLGLLLPFLIAMMAMALAVVPFDRRLRSTQQTDRAGAGQVARLFVLMLAPIALWFVVLSVLPDLRGWMLAPAALVVLLALVVVQPLILNVVMGTRPLDDDLRERVLALCRDHGLGVRDARMLDSRGGRIANAAISGILPQVRYVYLTDHLIEILDDDEMNAVLAHEIGLEPLASALDKIADANMVKRRTGWLWNVLQQHPGMEQRIKRLKDRAGVATHA